MVAAEPSMPHRAVSNKGLSSFERKPTDLDHPGNDILEDGINLLAREIRGHIMDSLHTKGVLRGQGRRRSESIAAMGRDDLLVGLETPGNTFP